MAFSTGISGAEKRRNLKKKNDICAIYPGHNAKLEVLGLKKLKKRHTVLGNPDKSRFKIKKFDLSGVFRYFSNILSYRIEFQNLRITFYFSSISP